MPTQNPRDSMPANSVHHFLVGFGGERKPLRKVRGGEIQLTLNETTNKDTTNKTSHHKQQSSKQTVLHLRATRKQQTESPRARTSSSILGPG